MNQNKIGREKECDVIMRLIFSWDSLIQIAKDYRLKKSTVQRIVNKNGILNLRNWRSGFYR